MTDAKQTNESSKKPEAAGNPERGTAASDESQNQNSEPQAGDSAPPSAQKNQDDRAAKAEEYYNQLVRTMADFENFRKRAARERMETARYASTALLEKLLPILDNLEMALSATEKAKEQSVDSLKTGVSMVLQQFKTALKDSGMEEIDATGQPFDPNLHEAVSQQESADVPEGHVALQLRKGYKIHDRLLRPASVVVAKPPSPAAPGETGEASSS